MTTRGEASREAGRAGTDAELTARHAGRAGGHAAESARAGMESGAERAREAGSEAYRATEDMGRKVQEAGKELYDKTCEACGQLKKEMKRRPILTGLITVGSTLAGLTVLLLLTNCFLGLMGMSTIGLKPAYYSDPMYKEAHQTLDTILRGMKGDESYMSKGMRKMGEMGMGGMGGGYGGGGGSRWSDMFSSRGSGRGVVSSMMGEDEPGMVRSGLHAAEDRLADILHWSGEKVRSSKKYT